jgi:signal transduction histidine kinase
VREGGRVDVVAEIAGDRLRISVRDTGKGLSGDLNASTVKGDGVGLSNIRERLQALYGDAGRLTLESNQPGPGEDIANVRGVTVTIEIPTVAMSGFSATGFSNGTAPLGIGGFAKTQPEPPKTWWGKGLRAAGATHSVWARAMSFTFIGIMIFLAILFGLALAGMATGWLPMQFGDTRISGMEGLAFGSVVLLFVFGVLAIAALLVVAVIYGLGVLAAGMLIFIPVAVIISMFPALAPFAVVGLFIYWIFFRKKKDVARTSKPS